MRAVGEAVALHTRFRDLLHHGDAVRFDSEAQHIAHGVYSLDRRSAIVSFAAIATGLSLTPPPLRLPGLEPDTRYEVSQLALPGRRLGPNRDRVGWLDHGVVLTGRQLAVHGLQLPALDPEKAILLHLRSV
jgi:alpha-galactosidase